MQKSPSPKKGGSDKCEVCDKLFSFWLQAHSCKWCYRAVCNDCKPDKSILVGENFEKQTHKMCKICKEENTKTKNLIKSEGLKFGQNSRLAQGWQKGIPSIASIPKKPYSEVEFTQDHLRLLWNSLSYSIKDFIGLVIEGVSIDDIHRGIKSVLNELNKTMDIALSSTAYLAIILLCYCSTDLAVKLCLHLGEGLKVTLTQRDHVNQWLKELGCFSQEISDLQEYMDERLVRFVGVLGMNLLPSEVVHLLLQEAIFNPGIVIKYFAALMATQKVLIISSRGRDKSDIDALILRKCNRLDIRSEYNKLKTNPKKEEENSTTKISNPLPKADTNEKQIDVQKSEIANTTRQQPVKELDSGKPKSPRMTSEDESGLVSGGEEEQEEEQEDEAYLEKKYGNAASAELPADIRMSKDVSEISATKISEFFQQPLDPEITSKDPAVSLELEVVDLQNKIKEFERTIQQNQQVIQEYATREADSTWRDKLQVEKQDIFQQESEQLKGRILILERDKKTLQTEKERLQAELLQTKTLVESKVQPTLTKTPSTLTITSPVPFNIEQTSVSQLQKRIELLEFTVKEKNTFLHNMNQENKRLTKEATTQRLYDEIKIKKVNEENQRLMRRLEAMSLEIVEREAKILQQNNEFEYE